MKELTEVKKILKILRENGVEEFKNGEFYVKLGLRAFLDKPMINTSTKLEKDEQQFTNSEDDLYLSGV
jgi:hypothetical protein